jgi:hypothetical protein
MARGAYHGSSGWPPLGPFCFGDIAAGLVLARTLGSNPAGVPVLPGEAGRDLAVSTSGHSGPPTSKLLKPGCKGLFGTLFLKINSDFS